MKKKVLSLLMALCMIITMFPITAFAADEMTLAIESVTADAGAESVSVNVNISNAVPFSAMGIQLTYNTEELELTGISFGEVLNNTGGTLTKNIAGNSWNADWGENVDPDDGVAYVLTFKVSPNASGDYQISAALSSAGCNNYDEEDVNPAFTAGSITVKPATVEGYTAGVNVTGNTVTVNKPVTVNVGVSHSSDSVYNAGEIVLNYDSSRLSLQPSSLGELKYTDNNGVLTIEDFGGDKSFATNNYAIVFETTAVGTANVTLSSAKFVHKDQASSSDLIAATIDPASVSITINEVTYPVTLPTDIQFSGSSVATKGEDYTFTVPEIGNYDYEITVTVGGTKIDTVTGPDESGEYTIPAASVTGDIVITYTREANTYEVTFAGDASDDVTDGADKATYNADYTFTMPSAAGFAYSLDSITINGSAYTGYTVEGSVYTIPGAAITGPIVITISKSATEASVTVQGDGAGAAAGYDTTADLNGDYTLTITPEAGYTYSVTATMGGTTANVIDNQNNTYTIKNVTGAIVFTVTKTLNVETVKVTEYVKVDSYVVYLVTYAGTLATGKAPTYDGKVMFWSDCYDAYCWLVIDSALTVDTAKTKIGAKSGTATDVDYGMDINGTNITDAADAQMVWNMYNALYNNFDTVTMAQFLAADQNATSDSDANWGLNVQDAQVIIAAILAGNATT